MYLKLFGLNSAQITDTNHTLLKFQLKQGDYGGLYERVMLFLDTQFPACLMSLKFCSSKNFQRYTSWLIGFMGEVLDQTPSELVSTPFVLLSNLSVGHYAHRMMEF